MNFRIPGILMSICLLVSVPGGTFAQLSDTLFELEEVRIVSDRMGLTEARTGRHMTVIRSSEIASLPVNSIDELLRYTPFLEIQSRGPFGAQSDILMRGSTFNQILVLVDGMRINDPLTGHFNSYIPVPITEISRIEVYRGPASAVYGPDAVGGVVNIITKSFEQGRNNVSIDGKLQAWTGQHKLRHSSTGINFSRERWKAGAGIDYNESDGHPLEPDSLRGDFRVITPSISLSATLSPKTRLAYRSAFDMRDFNARYFYTNSPLDLSREAIRKWWNQVQLEMKLNEAHKLLFQAAYQSTRDSFLFNPAFPVSIHRTRYGNYQLNHLFIHSSFRLASGIQFDQRGIMSNDRGNRYHWHAGAYSVLSGTIMDNLNCGAGLRLDYDPGYGMELLPQLNMSYILRKWVFRASAGRSIRSADFTEMYIGRGLEGPLSAGRNIGNPELRAERAWSIEGGIDREIAADLDFRLTGFCRFGRDLIDYTLTYAEDIPGNENLIPGEQYFYAGNIGLMDTRGIETELKGKHPLTGKWVLDWRLSLQALASGSDSAFVSKYLAAHSNNLVNGGLGLNSGGFSFRISTMYKSRNPESVRDINQDITSAYMLWNLRLDKFFWKKRLQASIQVNNLLDEQYSDILGAKMPGRWILGGLTWNFHR
jgi:iron complex outermembrane receptor protein